METTCMRGFSNTFVPDGKTEGLQDSADAVKMQRDPTEAGSPSQSIYSMEPPALQYIDSGELEHTWKTARRQRLKQQEEKIWTEFVKEQDVVTNVCHEDPYQFLEQLPESQLKDLMETELEKMKLEALEESKERKLGGDGDTPRHDNQHTVTFTELEREDEIFRIFDEDREDELSGIEEDLCAESGGEDGAPCTVREREDDSARRSPSRSPPPLARESDSKSSENVASVIESSIYCAKVKDLRCKIGAALDDIVTSVENVNVSRVEPQLLRSMCRRAAEFSARFQRIHLYQIQRQVYDIKRHNAHALPLAQHTQFQSQMARIVALHQYVLQGLQVFLKSIEQTGCLRESGDVLRALCGAIREAGSVCQGCAPPQDFLAASALYNDNILTSCEKLESTVTNYAERVSDIVDAAETTLTSRSKKSSKGKDRKTKLSSVSKTSSKANSKTDTNARLSMYSLDTLRHHQSRGSISKEHSKADKTSACKNDTAEKSPKSHRKSPRSRRPLMRAPAAGGRRRAAERDVQTMVQTLGPPSHVTSRDGSPQLRRRRAAHTAHTKRQSPHIKPALTYVNCENTKAGNSPAHPSSPIAKTQTVVPPLEGLVRDKSPRTKDASGKTGTAKSGDESAKVKSGNESGNGSVRSGNESDGKQCPPRTPNTGRVTPSIYRRGDKEKSRPAEVDPAGCEVTRLLRQLCGGDSTGGRSERNSGAKNAQLVCVNGGSPRQPSTPQLLRILEETIQKKVPKGLYHKSKPKDANKLRLAFNIPQNTADNLFQYRTKFVQHMLTSSMYANSAVGKPWEMIGSVSERIIDEILLKCANEMELQSIIEELYKSETQ